MKLEALPSIFLSLVDARCVEPVLRQIVEGLADTAETALVRLWLMETDDACPVCCVREARPDHSQSLHLAASVGKSIVSGKQYSRLDGTFHRVPVGTRKVGQIAQDGRPLLEPHVTPNLPWVADPEWVKAEKIKSFAGQPLIFRGKVLGVLCVFSRAALTPADFMALRTFADVAAVAIANARAFEEIETLKQRLEHENAYLQDEVKEASDFGNIVGESPALKKVLQQIRLVASTDASVLILGESGTGKELIARAIHESSRRKERPLIKVNCGAIPENLFESEMFGHVKGAFTGAVKDRVGRFELADGGTLFLDEVGEISLAHQAKLLRVLQEQQFERVGDERTRRVDVRIVAATNRDLRADAEAGRFRQDLFYRLSVFPIDVPPLRSRPEDIPVLAAHLIRVTAKKLNLKLRKLTREQLSQLTAHDWPGNVRELQNVLEHALILSQNGPMVPLSDVFARKLSDSKAKSPGSARSSGSGILTRDELRERERESIQQALVKTNGKVFGPGGAAEMLGMKGTTLASRIKALGIESGV